MRKLSAFAVFVIAALLISVFPPGNDFETQYIPIGSCWGCESGGITILSSSDPDSFMDDQCAEWINGEWTKCDASN